MSFVSAQGSLRRQQKLENSINLIRKITMCFIVVVLFFTVFIAPMTRADAIITKTGSGKNAVFTDSAGNEYKVSEMNSKVIGGNVVLDMAQSIYGGMSNFGADILKVNLNASYWTQGVMPAYNALVAVGVGLALCWCLMELIEKASAGHVTGEFLLQLGIKFTIAAVVVSEGGHIAEYLVQFGNGVVDLVTGSIVAGSSSGLDNLFADVYNDIKNSGFMACIGYIFQLILPAMMMKICTIIMFALLAGRLIEIGVRFIFFPIGAADVFTHGMGSPGFRYMKKLAGAAMQGVAMYVVMYIGMFLMANPTEVFGSGGLSSGVGAILGPVFTVIVAISMIGGMLKVSSIINDITG